MNAPIRIPAAALAAAPISDFHRTLTWVERSFDAARFNANLNHPEVYPFVRGTLEGPLDLAPVVANPANVLLMGEQGGILFVRLQPGLYEAHSHALPEGRGRWMLQFTRAAIHWMFCRTDAVELVTRCPHGNRPALALTKAIGGVFEFRNEAGWIMDGRVVAADIYSLSLQSWVRTAPGLPERGHWFHEKLESEFARHGFSEPPHADDAFHDRAVGLACEMLIGGQPDKTVIFYSRIAALADYGPISIVSRRPLAIDIGTAILAVRDDGDFWAMTVNPQKGH